MVQGEIGGLHVGISLEGVVPFRTNIRSTP